MKKFLSLLLLSSLVLTIIVGCGNKDIAKEKEKEVNESKEEIKMNKELQIVVQGDDIESITFQLNDSIAAKSFYEQLPLTIEVENYSNDEKIIYPPEKLDVTDTPLAKGPIGTLAYYEPWGDVVMYYGDCNGAEGLYALGDVITGADQISKLTGSITINKVNDTSKQDDANTTDDNQTLAESPVVSENDNQIEQVDGMHHIQITIANQIFTASLYDNETVRALLNRLPMTIEMDELHGNEKYYYFSNGLPSNSQGVSQIYTGDIKLYGSDCLVMFYKDFPTTFTYTSLGYVDNPQGLSDILGSGNVTVKIQEQ